jgi:hypothetical protein
VIVWQLLWQKGGGIADLTSMMAEIAPNDGGGGSVDDGNSNYDAGDGYYGGSDDW